ncbi:hypothetical protein D3C85_805540 [compost metagenome]
MQGLQVKHLAIGGSQSLFRVSIQKGMLSSSMMQNTVDLLVHEYLQVYANILIAYYVRRC